jgi:hypothetical protein
MFGAIAVVRRKDGIFVRPETDPAALIALFSGVGASGGIGGSGGRI